MIHFWSKNAFSISIMVNEDSEKISDNIYSTFSDLFNKNSNDKVTEILKALSNNRSWYGSLTIPKINIKEDHYFIIPERYSYSNNKLSIVCNILFKTNYCDPNVDYLEINYLVKLINDLRHEKLKIYYQNIFDQSKSIKTVEALCRRTYIENGVKKKDPPNQFIPIMDRYKFSHEINFFLFKRALIDFKIMLERNPDININLNLSPTQLNTATINELIFRCKEYGVPTSKVFLEITEQFVENSSEYYVSIIKKIKKHGFKIELDDFGAGYSNISRISKWDLDGIKIDKLIIDEILVSKKMRQLVSSLIEVAHVLNLHVTAEGIENELQFDVLKDIKCDYFQGYYLSKPTKNY